MPDFVFTGPDGKDHVVSGPEGSTPQEAFARFQAAMGGGDQATPSATADTGGIGRNALASVTEAVTGLPAALGNIASLPSRLIYAGTGQKPIIGSALSEGGEAATKAANKGVEAVTGFNPDKVTAKTMAERAARFIPGAVVSAMTPGGEGTLAEKAASGLRFGIGGDLAQEAVPDWAKPYAAFLGGLFGEAGYQGAKVGVKAAASGPTAARFSDTTRNQQVRNIIEDTATNPADVKAKALAPNTGVSEPSMYQESGDTGIGGLEETLSTTHGPNFVDLKRKQEASRQATLQGIQPEGQGAQFDLSQHITGQLNTMDKNMETAAQNVLQKAQDEAAGTGSGKSNEARGQEMRDALLEANDKREEVAKWFFNSVNKDETGNVTATIDAANGIRADADKYGAEVGGEENKLLNRAQKLKPVESYGTITQLRSDVSARMREVIGKDPEEYRRLTLLRGAIEKNLTDTISDVYSGNIKNPASSEAANLMRGIDRDTLAGAASDVIDASRPPEKPESIIDVARNMPGGGIRPSIVGGKETSESAAVRARLPINAKNGKGSTWQDFQETLNQRGWLKFQPQAGEHPDDLIGALDRGNKFYHPEDDTAQRIQHRDQIEQEMNEAGVSADDKHELKVAKLANYRNKQRNLEDMVPGLDGPEQMAPQRPTTVVKPTIKAGDVDNLKKGSALWAQNKSDRLGPVDAILKRAGNKTDFTKPASEVGGVVFKPGPGGYENAQKVVNYLGQEKGQALLSDEAAASLNKAALRDDGTIDPKAYARWQKSHAEAIRALPDETKMKFQSAATATQWADEMKAKRTQAVKEMQQGAIGKVMNAGTPEDMNRAIGGIFSMQQGGQAAMRDIALRARSNPAAEQGLRRATMDFITDKFISNATDEIKSKGFQDFVAKNRGVLSEIFKPSEVENIAAVAADLKRSNMKYEPQIGPATARRTYQVGKGYVNGPRPVSTGLRLVLDTLGAQAGRLVFGHIPVVKEFAEGLGAYGAEMAQGLRQGGITRIDDALARVFTNTDFRKQIMSLDPTSGSSMVKFKAAMRRSAVVGAKSTMVQQMGRASP